MKKILILFGLVLLAFGLKAQHAPMYSQYMFNQMVINPAYTGSRGALSITGLYRHQWAGFEGAPRTQSLIAHSPLKNLKNNLGFSLVNDQIGVSNRTHIFGSYAYRIIGSKVRFSMGLQGGVSLIQDKWSKIVTNQGNDQVFSSDSPLFVVPQFGFGAWLDTEKFYLGASSPTVFTYKTGDYAVYVSDSLRYNSWFATAGTVITLNPFLKLKPSLLFKYLRNSPAQFDINANLIIKEAFWAGISYRTGDALVAMIEYQINPQFRIGYSFDQSVTTLRKYNNGSHEFMLRYEFGYNVKAMSPPLFLIFQIPCSAAVYDPIS